MGGYDRDRAPTNSLCSETGCWLLCLQKTNAFYQRIDTLRKYPIQLSIQTSQKLNEQLINLRWTLLLYPVSGTWQ